MFPPATLLSPRNSVPVISKPFLCAAPIVTKTFSTYGEDASILHLYLKKNHYLAHGNNME